MNRKINLTKSAIDRTMGAIKLALGSREKKMLAEHKAKVYVIYNGTDLECWLIDLDMQKEGDEIEKTQWARKSDSENNARPDSQYYGEVSGKTPAC